MQQDVENRSDVTHKLVATAPHSVADVNGVFKKESLG